MKALARMVTTTVALAALSILPAGAAHAGPPQVDQRSGERPHATQPRHHTVWRCNAGHGPQFDCRDAGPLPGQPSPGPSASTPAGRGGRLDLARSVVMLGLLVTLAGGGYWLRRRHRPREAI